MPGWPGDEVPGGAGTRGKEMLGLGELVLCCVCLVLSDSL